MPHTKVLLIVAFTGFITFGLTPTANASTPPMTPAPNTSTPDADATSQVSVTFTGGHETDPQDRGRPVILIAAALNVPAEVFRDAFAHVRPAPPGQEPEPAQVQRNKEALLGALAPYGVTNDRLDEVSNYYRYRAWKGELWRVKPAAAVATVRNGVATAISVTDPGSGYSSPPAVSVPGVSGISFDVKLSFGTDLAKNGSIREIAIASGAAPSTNAAPPSGNAAFQLRSPVVTDNGNLPADFTGDGSGATPPLEWSGAPAETKCYALIMHHIDREGVTKWYWTLYNIPAGVTSLPRNVTGVGALGNNSINSGVGYAPPHSKGPGPKMYTLTLYALSQPVQVHLPAEQVSRAVLLDAMKNITLATSELHVIYTRNGN